MLYSLLLIAALALTPAPSADPCSGWQSVAGESKLQFVASFEGAPAPGAFRQFSVCLDFDAEQPGTGRLEVWIDIASADMDSADINQAIAGPEWFDAMQFPRAHYLSEEIEPGDSSAFVAHGRLSLKGVEREVSVPFGWQVDGADRKMAGELTLRRSDFEIGVGEWAGDDSIGVDVTVRFEVTLRTAP